MEIKNGKKPLSAKPRTTRMNLDDIFTNPLALDPELKQELESKGLVARFISVAKFRENGGNHERGWVPYKRATMKAPQDDIFGSNPDGYIRRGDSVLAVRPKELNEKHKTYLRQKAAERSNPVASRAAEIRKMAQAAGVEMDVREGDDEE